MMIPGGTQATAWRVSKPSDSLTHAAPRERTARNLRYHDGPSQRCASISQLETATKQAPACNGDANTNQLFPPTLYVLSICCRVHACAQRPGVPLQRACTRRPTWARRLRLLKFCSRMLLFEPIRGKHTGNIAKITYLFHVEWVNHCSLRTGRHWPPAEHACTIHILSRAVQRSTRLNRSRTIIQNDILS